VLIVKEVECVDEPLEALRDGRLVYDSINCPAVRKYRTKRLRMSLLTKPPMSAKTTPSLYAFLELSCLA